jgi:uncharacterized SAM-dependent methyltransferase
MIHWPVLPFKPTHKVIVENNEHEYKAGTIVQHLYSSGLTEYAWYTDEEGWMQIMDSTELEVL